MLCLPQKRWVFMLLVLAAWTIPFAAYCFIEAVHWHCETNRETAEMIADPHNTALALKYAHHDGPPIAIMHFFMVLPMGFVFFFVLTLILLLCVRYPAKAPIFFVGPKKIVNVLFLFCFAFVSIWYPYEVIHDLLTYPAHYWYDVFLYISMFFSSLAIGLPFLLLRALLVKQQPASHL